MSVELDTLVEILDSAAAPVLSLTHANGYHVVTLQPPRRERARDVATSPFADGSHEIRSNMVAGRYGLVVRVHADTWAAVETLKNALVDGLEQPGWLLRVTVEGVAELWRCNAADVDPAFDDLLAMSGRRVITADIPVQPHPTVTGAV